MKKSIIVIISILLIAGLIIGFCAFVSNDNEKMASQNYNSSTNQENIINEINNSSIPQNTIETKTITQESELASFSTNLQGDDARLNNIKITCDTINGTIVNSGETFSFNKIVGQPSANKGYQEADVIVDTKVEKGYGGGNCQVSTTIYNACLEVSGIEIVERNPHKKNVTYVPQGKDAAVSYSGGLDFKFKNNTDSPIKIYINSDNNEVSARIVREK